LVSWFRVTRRGLLQLAAANLPLAAQEAKGATALPLAEARRVLDEFSGELPEGLRRAAIAEAPWREWALAHDRQIRSRLKRGDADSIVNLVLFGNSFTSQPRPEEASGSDQAAAAPTMARLRDFAAAVSHPGRNERLQFAAQWLKENGADPASGNRVIAVVVENIRRVLSEQREYSQQIEAARQKDAASLFTEKSSLYRDRGLSLDTSFRPNYAIEKTLADLKSAGLLRKARRSAVIGPGLDFTNKNSAYDFYPPQTLQPFALVDSLLRLGLADSPGPSLGIFDLSGRVLSHVRQAIAQARAGSGYTLQLALDEDTAWLPGTVEYWREACTEIGEGVAALAPPRGVSAQMRAVRVRPGVVGLLEPSDLDIVIERLVLPEARRFDLIVATNILVYYSPFEKALALANVAAMLRAGGLLLSNDVLPEVKGIPIRPAGATSVAYSASPDDSDKVMWYRRTG